MEEIERLLNKYYEGNTTESQEEVLKKYFETQDVPQRLLKDKKIFLSLRENVYMAVPTGLEDKLSRMIDQKEEEERKFFKRNWRWTGGIAASLVLLFGLGYSISNFRDSVAEPQDTFTDPQDAYKVLQATLMEVSADMNCGINQVKETRREIKRINKEVRKEIQ